MKLPRGVCHLWLLLSLRFSVFYRVRLLNLKRCWSCYDFGVFSPSFMPFFFNRTLFFVWVYWSRACFTVPEAPPFRPRSKTRLDIHHSVSFWRVLSADSLTSHCVELFDTDRRLVRDTYRSRVLVPLKKFFYKPVLVIMSEAAATDAVNNFRCVSETIRLLWNEPNTLQKCFDIIIFCGCY